jgi:hypothetical protein
VQTIAVALEFFTPKDIGTVQVTSWGIDARSLSKRELPDESLWRIASPANEGATIEEQVQALNEVIAFGKLSDKPIRAILSVAVFYDTLSCTVQIPPSCLDLLAGSRLTIEVICYPVAEEQGS